MSEIVLKAERRTAAGRHANQTRAKGLVPGIYYSRGEENIAIQVDKVSLDPLVFTSKTHVIDLQIADGTAKKCILRAVQFDPVTDRPIHFDLLGLKESEKLTIEVPITITGGIPAGVRDGGVLQHIVHKVKVSCLPKDIPEKVEVDVSQLAINQFVHVRDLKIPNVTVLDNPDISVIGVMPPTVTKEAEVAAPTEVAAAEPEVVGKGKKAEEGEAGGEAPKADAKAPKADAKEKK
jgi:large subunit ribosomal protein L25